MVKKKENLIMVVKLLIAVVEIMVLVYGAEKIDYIKIKKESKKCLTD